MAADPRVCLHDILNAIAGAREAVGAADFPTYPTYCRRRPMSRAVEREIEIISEASRRVPQEAEGHGVWHSLA